MGNKKTKDGKGGGGTGKTGDKPAAGQTNSPPKEPKSYKVLLIGDRYVLLILQRFG
jgi:hypothetical protein